VDVDDRLRPPQQPYVHAWIRAHARSRDGSVREELASGVMLGRGPAPFVTRRSELAGQAHHAVAEALHIHLALVATPVGGFGDLPADQLATLPF
jgi:hypothetical protein